MLGSGPVQPQADRSASELLHCSLLQPRGLAQGLLSGHNTGSENESQAFPAHAAILQNQTEAGVVLGC